MIFSPRPNVNELQNLQPWPPAYQGDNPLAACWGEQFGYDPWGNLLSIGSFSSAYTGCTQENLSVAVNTKNQIIGNTYDAAGNLILTQPGNVQYVYDAENHLTSAGGQTYLYDGDGKRVEKASGSPLAANQLYWYGTDDSPVIETDPAGNELYRYFRFQGLLVTREEANDWVDHYGLDALGDVRWLYSHNGGWDVIDYYPSGGTRILQSSSDNNTRMFTSKERDPESNLDNFGARYNSSSMGRFRTPDWSATPAAVPFANPADPQSLNLYSYVVKNPLNRTDPTGHNWFCTSGNTSNCGHWEWHKGSTYTDANGNRFKSDYTGLLTAQANGTDKKTGATLYKLTLYDQNKAVATGTGFSGGMGQPAIKDGNYLIRLDIRGPERA